MNTRVTVIDELFISYSADGERGEVVPRSTVTYEIGAAPQQGGLSGQTKLLLAIPSADARLFLLLFPTGGLTMSVLWNGTDVVDVPALFITTDDGYEVDSQGVVTPIAVTNPTTGGYRFWRGETPEDYAIYPGGEDLTVTTIPDTEVF
jgi:hypothetical protein